MFSIGEQLYRLTQRDEETLLVDPYARSQVITLIIGAAVAQFDFPIQVDRSFFLHSFRIACNPEAATTWVSISLNARDAQNNQIASIWAQASTPGLNNDGGNNTIGVGGTVIRNVPMGLLLPPGISVLQAAVQRIGTTGPIGVGASLLGYQLPPGRIGRVS